MPDARDLPEFHDRALRATAALVAGTTADQMHLATPCDDWDVRRLLTHVVAGNLWVGELVDGKTIDEVGDRFDGDVLGDDPHGAYDRSAAAAGAAFKAEGAMDRPVAVSYGPVPGSIYCGHRFLDVLVHGWDLAKATGQSTALDDELARACLEVVEPQADLLKGSGMFHSDVVAPDGADAQTRLLALLGRQA
jgi:uncharacterized protein (TIGR03086 family)